MADLLGIKKKDNRITIIPFPPVVTIPYPVPYPVPSPFRRWEVTHIGIGDSATTATITTSGNDSSTIIDAMSGKVMIK